MATYKGVYSIPFKVYECKDGYFFMENDDVYAGSDEKIWRVDSCLGKYKRVEDPLELCFCGCQPALVINKVDGKEVYHYCCIHLSKEDNPHSIRSASSWDNNEAVDFWNNLMRSIKNHE